MAIIGPFMPVKVKTLDGCSNHVKFPGLVNGSFPKVVSYLAYPEFISPLLYRVNRPWKFVMVKVLLGIYAPTPINNRFFLVAELDSTTSFGSEVVPASSA